MTTAVLRDGRTIPVVREEGIIQVMLEAKEHRGVDLVRICYTLISIYRYIKK